MDYGYQVLRHIVQQVFGNLGPAARITLVPILFGYIVAGVIVYSVVGPMFFQILQLPTLGDDAPPFLAALDAIAFAERFFLTVLLVLPIVLVCYAWAAVGWHRYVLLEEPVTGIAARWNWRQIRSYVGAVLRVLLLLLAIGYAASLVVQTVLTIAPSPALAQFLTIALNIVFTWAGARIGLVLPSAALGRYMKLGESWTATAPVAGAIMLPIIVVPIGFAILFSVLGFVPIVGIFLIFAAFWLQTLVNLALMTTLYGNLIEGRQLN